LFGDQIKLDQFSGKHHQGTILCSENFIFHYDVEIWLKHFRVWLMPKEVERELTVDSVYCAVWSIINATAVPFRLR
jgi:hypothetical protein